MPETIRILAPAPIRHVPARARHARTSYAAIQVDAVLRELSTLDATEGPRIPLPNGQTLATRILDGVPWRPIGTPDAFATNRSNGPSGETFRAWLRGDEDTRALVETDLGRALEGTPLLARVPGQKSPERPDGLWNVARQGALVLDTRERMPGLVRAYVEQDIALVDGLPFMRMPGPLVYPTTPLNRRDPFDAEKAVRLQVVAHPGGWTTNAAVAMGNLYRIDRMKDVARVERLDASRIKPSWNPADFSGMPLRDDDMSVMLKESLRILADNRPLAGYPFGREREDRLFAYAALGSVGAIEEQDMAEAWRFVREFSLLVSRGQEMGWVIGEARRILAYADGVAVQRVTAKTLDPAEDIEALGALAMP